MTFDSEQRNIVIALVLVASICTAILGITDWFTREPIAQAQRAAFMKGLMQVLPKHSNDPSEDTYVLTQQGKETPFYLARDAQNNIIGIAWPVIAPDGYSGSIHILIGAHTDGSIYAIRITEHKETPGLGDGIVTNQQWLASFIDKTLTNTRWLVYKDGGNFDQFTGATISPRAVVKAVKKGLEIFHSQRQAILAQTASKNQDSDHATH